MLDDLFAWAELPPTPAVVVPWRPSARTHDQWPPDYRAVYAWRMKQLARMRSDPAFAASARAYYAKPGKAAEFIMDWMDTYNPRGGGLKWMPFVFFKRQLEFIECLEECIEDQESLLVEKARDVGLTWLCSGWSVAKWLFAKDFAIGWGSRKQDLVDTLGDPDSIFEKMRLLLKRIPREFLPSDYQDGYLRFINRDNGSTITGEGGDNIGRGGRKAVYFKDESAHYMHAEAIEAALGDNTNVQVDISSVNGLGNVFHRKRENGVEWKRGVKIDPGVTRVFVVDWRDHPAKTQAWYDLRRAKWERDGLLHLFKQEVDRDYAGAIKNSIIPREWIKAAFDAHKRVPWIDERGNGYVGIPEERLGGGWGAGFDIGDGGDPNGLALRQSIVLRKLDEWAAPDPGVSARRAIDFMRPYPWIEVQYDAVGMGATVKAEYNRLTLEGIIDEKSCVMVPWNAGAKVLNPFDRVVEDDPNSPLNKDFYGNLKAQAWWSLRQRFWRTYNAVTKGIIYDIDDLISIDTEGCADYLRQIEKELAQVVAVQNGRLQMIIDKKPDGTKSPNLADACVMAYFPIPSEANFAIVGGYGNA